MLFSVFSHVQHSIDDQGYFAYSPYVDEMNIWLKQVSQVRIIAPISNKKKQILDNYYQHNDLKFIAVSSFAFTSFLDSVAAFFAIPKIMIQIAIEMQKADHIHLRCPGNIGLLACVVQLFFPSKPKTVKYAGNWDPNAKQPFSYKLQKAILSSAILSKNIKVLVYGDWPDQSKNIVPFFTATYSEKEKTNYLPKSKIPPIQFLFVGTLTKGKNVLYAIELIEKLNENGIESILSIFGIGSEEEAIFTKINNSKFKNKMQLKGNCDREKIKLQYQNSHFLILASKSEGWPKVVAEAMFWGCVPIATSISCITKMLDNGKNGIILTEDILTDFTAISAICANQEHYTKMVQSAINWSQKFTLELFEQQITFFLKT